MKEKLLMLKSIVGDINSEILFHKSAFYWNTNDETKEEYMNKYYPNFETLFDKVKIWINLNIEYIDYYLSSVKYYLDAKSNKFDEETIKEIIGIYRSHIVKIFRQCQNLENLDIVHNVIRKQITDDTILNNIKNNKSLDKLIMNIDNATMTITDSLNRFISNINNLYTVSAMTNEKEHIDIMIEEVKEYYLVKVNDILGSWYRGGLGELLYREGVYI